jgi:tRNA threonylcarbamoyladenosine biosynthesis protein TsaB
MSTRTIVQRSTSKQLLVLDTSTERGVVGVVERSGAIYVATIEAARRHGRDLIPAVATTLEAGGLAVRDIELIAVGLGPGSYTGLRVGLAAAKTFSYVTGAAVIGLDSLEAVARNAPPDAVRISVVADAQRGELYVAEFQRQAPAAALVETRGSAIEPIDAWLARLEAGTFVLGPGLNVPRIAAVMPRWVSLPEPALNYPQVPGLVALAYDTWASGRRDDPWQLDPRYLRRSSAEEKWGSRTGARPD